MTQSQDVLRAGLTQFAEGAGSVDLYDRALARSRQIGRRRAALAVAGFAAAVLAVGAGVIQVVPRNSAAPDTPRYVARWALSRTDQAIANTVAVADA